MILINLSLFIKKPGHAIMSAVPGAFRAKHRLFRASILRVAPNLRIGNSLLWQRQFPVPRRTGNCPQRIGVAA